MPSGKPLLKAPRRTHADLKRQVMLACNRLPGVFIFPTGVGSFVSVYKGRKRFIRLGMMGTSDLVGWRMQPVLYFDKHYPVFVALEIKTGKDTVSAEQAAFLEKVSQAGGIACVVREVADAIRVLS